MKKLLLIILAIATFSFTFGVLADQRCDMDTQNCHISLDPNDDDTEIDVPAAMYNAQVNRYVSNGVRKANGSYHGFIKLPMNNENIRPPLLIPHSAADVFTKGNANTRPLDEKFIVAQNTECNLVRSNFQENTGSDDQNQTQYTSNDWDLAVTWYRYEDENGNEIKDFVIGDEEWDLNDDGVTDLSDFSIYRNNLAGRHGVWNYGVWYVAMNCRGGTA